MIVFLAALGIVLAVLAVKLVWFVYTQSAESGYDDEAVKRYQIEKMSK